MEDAMAKDRCCGCAVGWGMGVCVLEGGGAALCHVWGLRLCRRWWMDAKARSTALGPLC